MNTLWNELLPMLSDMEVPSFRIESKDHRWLLRNLGVKNSDHSNFVQALNLLKQIAKYDIREVIDRGDKLITG
jgi:hypothetical protein